MIGIAAFRVPVTALPGISVAGLSRLLAAGVALALAGCSEPAPTPASADPAIWHVSGLHGEEAWLFGTIHSAPEPLAWRSTKVSEALARSGEIVVEVANISDEAAVAQAFTGLSRSPGLPPIAQRVAPARRRDLEAMLAARNIAPESLRDVETWAVALILARPEDGTGTRNGVDRAVLASAKGKPVVELEGAAAQLSIFDRLPEADQRDLLHAVLTDAGALDSADADLVDIWRKGDMARIEAETRTGLLADPELRGALFTRRNHRWLTRIKEEMEAGRRPFVAVGGAHMVGPDGLVELLRNEAYTVTRLQ